MDHDPPSPQPRRLLLVVVAAVALMGFGELAPSMSRTTIAVADDSAAASSSAVVHSPRRRRRRNRRRTIQRSVTRSMPTLRRGRGYPSESTDLRTQVRWAEPPLRGPPRT